MFVLGASILMGFNVGALFGSKLLKEVVLFFWFV
jgi:hypothetical protein